VVGLIVAVATWFGANTNTIFNGLLALFTYLLWRVSKEQADIAEKLAGVTNEMKTATTDAAKAAQQSAHAAELALNAERPYVFIESYNLKTSWFVDPGYRGGLAGITATTLLTRRYASAPDATHVELNLGFVLRNRGKGVAIIEDVRMRFIDTPQTFFLRGVPVFSGKPKVVGRYMFYIPQSILGGGETSEPISTLNFTLPAAKLRDMLTTPRSRVPIFLIRVAYTDVYGRSYSWPAELRYFGSDLLYLNRVRAMRRIDRLRGRKARPA
jgi:hypothetical protein